MLHTVKFRKDKNTVWAYNYYVFVDGNFKGFVGRTSLKVHTLNICIADYIESREARRIEEHSFNEAKKLIREAILKSIKQKEKEREFWSKIKYLPRENAEVILRLARKCKEIYPECRFLLSDCDGYTAKRKTPEGVVKWIDGLDSDIDVYVRKNDNEDEIPVGWFFLTPGEEEDCVICDYTANDFCEEVMKGI